MTITLTPVMTLQNSQQSLGNPVLTIRDRDADVDAVFTNFSLSGLPLRRWRLTLLIDSTPSLGKGPAQVIQVDTNAPATAMSLSQTVPYVRVKDIENKVGGNVACRLLLEWLSGSQWVPYAEANATQVYAAPAAAKTNIPLGINAHLFSAAAPAEVWRPALDAIVAAGGTHVRTSIPWGMIENGGKGVRDANMLAMIDTFMTDVGSRGLKLLVVLGGAAPDWTAPAKAKTAWTYTPHGWAGAGTYGAVWPTWSASGSFVAGQLGPDNWQDFEDHVTWFLGRYANGGLAGAGGTVVFAIENMNEPFVNTAQTRDGGTTGGMNGTPIVTLATWQQHLYAAARAANATIKVGSMVSSYNDWMLLQNLYNTGIFKGNYDAVSVHPYPVTFKAPGGQRCYDPRFPLTDAHGEWHHHPASLGYFIDVMAANNDPAEVWVTEFGQSVGDSAVTALNVSPQEQADHLAYMWRLLTRYQKVGAVFMHTAEDKGADYFVSSPRVWANFGIVRADHISRKPSFASVQAVLAQIKAGTA